MQNIFFVNYNFYICVMAKALELNNITKLAEKSEIPYVSIYNAKRKADCKHLSVTERKRIISELEKAHKANIKFFEVE